MSSNKSNQVQTTSTKEVFHVKQFTEKKAKNQVVTKYIDTHLSYKMLYRFEECGEWLDIITNASASKKKVLNANLCKHRFCPLCAYIKSYKQAYKLYVMTEYITDVYEYDYIFLTLTAPNVKGDKLRETIGEYNKAFDRLMRYKEVTNACKGFIRKLEVTYNKKRNDYHPHFHVVIAVKKTYFKDRTYLTRTRWLDLWCRAMRDPSILIVDVRAVKNHKEGTLQSGIFEIAKYTAKDTDYTQSQEVFDAFYKALIGHRDLTYGGVFREARTMFENNELKKYELESDMAEYIWRYRYIWLSAEYQERKKEPFSFVEYMEKHKSFKDGEYDEYGQGVIVDEQKFEEILGWIEQQTVRSGKDG
jgi:plasmid rolling circle replication initiator protein Rep